MTWCDYPSDLPLAIPLSNCHFWSSFIQNVMTCIELKAQVSYSDRPSSIVCPSVCKLFTLVHFHPNLAQSNLGKREHNEEPRPFPRGYNYEIVTTKLGTKHTWVNGIQVCSNEGPGLFLRGDNYEIAKILTSFSTKLGTKHHLMLINFLVNYWI